MNTSPIVVAFVAVSVLFAGCEQPKDPANPVAMRDGSPARVEALSGPRDSPMAMDDAMRDAGAEVPLQVTLRPANGSAVNGVLTVASSETGIRVRGRISGLRPGAEHGFHLHEHADCSAPDAASAGDHFNPQGTRHGHPQHDHHHGGDLLNLHADADGAAIIEMSVDSVTLGDDMGPSDIRNLAFVVHARADDFKSQPSGNSGERIACGVTDRDRSGQTTT